MSAVKCLTPQVQNITGGRRYVINSVYWESWCMASYDIKKTLPSGILNMFTLYLHSILSEMKNILQYAIHIFKVDFTKRLSSSLRIE